MATISHLEKPPVTEAIIDIRVELPENFKVNEFEKLKDQLVNEYPESKEIHVWKGRFELNPEKPLIPPKHLGAQGISLKSKDRSNVTQFRVDGFTFSRLPLYSSWEEISEQAFKLWKIYSNLTNPKSITRLATRFINEIKFKLPCDNLNLNDYFTALPSLPEELSGVHGTFLSRFAIQDPATSISAKITQTTEGKIVTDTYTLILDIDVFQSVSLSLDDEKIWTIFEDLRKMKNNIFFSLITNKTKELFS